MEWIDVNEKVPENNDKVLVTDGKEVGVGYYEVSGFVGSDIVYPIEFFKPTHWTHLPKPYQPERSKREDSLIREMIESSKADLLKIDNDPPYPLVWGKDLNFIGHKIIEEMRCSEQ